MIRAVVFDRDDVLTEFDLAAAGRFFSTLLPIPLSELGRRWRALQRDATASSLLLSLEEETPFLAAFWEGLADEFGLSAAERARLLGWDYTSIIKVFPDAAEALRQARARGLGIGVLSNFRLASITRSLEAAGLMGYVDAALSPAVIGVRKPAPEAYLAICRALGVEPAECLFFDNLPMCVAGARAVGMRAYLVDRSRAEHALDEGVVRDLSAVGLLAGPESDRGA